MAKPRLAIWFCLMACICWTNAADWHAIPGGRWKSLADNASGSIGFSRVDPSATGIRFTNFLSDAASATNRVLEDGSGVAVGDFNGDGQQDLFFCSLQGSCVLYENRGNFKFTDVTAESGLVFTGLICRGAVFADVNGDGWLDLLVTVLGQGVHCWFNDSTGHFTNATAFGRTGSPFGSMSMALADIDGNGTLDLYVANYRTDDIRDRARIPVRHINGQAQFAPEYRDRLRLIRGGLFEFGEPDILMLNDGHGHFTPVSWTGGNFLQTSGKSWDSPPLDWGLSATFHDLNGDGLPDLYVCNDYATPDRIWIGNGKGQFRAPPGYVLRHTPENSMGMDAADIDGDGLIDFVVVDMLSRNSEVWRRQALAQTVSGAGPPDAFNRPQYMCNVLQHNRGDGTFEELSAFAGISASEWSWQPLFVDVDLDGRPDLLISAGHQRDVQDLDVTGRILQLQRRWPPGVDPKIHQAGFDQEKMAHARLYPAGLAPVVGYHNLGKLRFRDETTAWGLGELGVHQGFATADLDGDGDLDLVVNNLNGMAGIYRNNGTAPRLAVQLRGITPNTRGIGARIRLLNGAVPSQTMEMVSGGRYLSGCEELVVFGTGTTVGGMVLEIDWRSGRRSVITNVSPGRLYEPSESDCVETTGNRTQIRNELGLMEDVSQALHHRHVENRVDEFARQPLLPRALGRLGPGAAWADFNGDGHDDLVIGTSAGGVPAIFLGDGRGNFAANTNRVPPTASGDETGILFFRDENLEPILLAGELSSPEGGTQHWAGWEFHWSDGISNGLPKFPSSPGPLVMGPLYLDGSQGLFIGGRVVPGRFPELAASAIFRRTATGWEQDAPNSQTVSAAGLVSGAVWSDLNGDGFSELIVACEWGPLRIYQNNSGTLVEVTAEWGVAAYTGLWACVAVGDFDGDGKLDLVASNWGLNSTWKADLDHPLRLYHGDFNHTGGVDLLEAIWDSQRSQYIPPYRLNEAARGLGQIRGVYGTHRAFAMAGAMEVLDALQANFKTATAGVLTSSVFLNRGGKFEIHPLPDPAQYSAAMGVAVADFDGDGHQDLFLSQNFFEVRPELTRQDAGRGLLLHGVGNGEFEPWNSAQSGIAVDGEQRGTAVSDFNEDGRPDLVVTQNGDETRLFMNRTGKPGLRVRVHGPPQNPDGFGSVMRLEFSDHWGPAWELHGGSGYWSQDSGTTILPTPSQPVALQIQWPGGRTTRTEVPWNCREITASWDGTSQTK